MYPISKAIFDNTVFNNIIRVKSADLSNVFQSIIGEVLVPQSIMAEMENWAQNPIFASRIGYFTNQIRRNQFYKFCSSLNPIVFEEAKKHIDSGEADAVAQSDKTGVMLFITDDEKCQDYIRREYPNIRLHSSFFLIALAHFNALLPNAHDVFREFHNIYDKTKMRPENKRQIKKRQREEACEALKVLGFPMNKKEIEAIVLT